MIDSPLYALALTLFVSNAVIAPVLLVFAVAQRSPEGVVIAVGNAGFAAFLGAALLTWR